MAPPKKTKKTPNKKQIPIKKNQNKKNKSLKAEFKMNKTSQ